MLEPYAIAQEQGYIFRDYQLGMFIIAFSHTEMFIDYSYNMKMHEIYISMQRCPAFFEEVKIPPNSVEVGEAMTLSVYLAKKGVSDDSRSL